MAKVRLFDYLKENMCTIKTLIKAGQVAPDLLHHFQVYGFYESTEKIKSKMERYQFTASQFRISIDTVMRVIKKMEQLV